MNEMLIKLYGELEYESVEENGKKFAKVNFDMFCLMMGVIGKAGEINESLKTRIM